jgi:type VI secretion system protein VasD
MTTRRQIVCIAALAGGIAAVAACAGMPKPSIARITMLAAADANPDAGGRPSPVVIRVYQLKTDAAFTSADFFALFDDEQKVLGAQLINRTEFMLVPAERRAIELEVSPDTRFVGAVAAFRDIRNAQWRVLVPVKRGSDLVTVAVERARVVLSTRN